MLASVRSEDERAGWRFTGLDTVALQTVIPERAGLVLGLVPYLRLGSVHIDIDEN